VAKFTFKLEGVLEQRKHAERHRQRELATAQHKLLRLQADVDALAAVNRASAADLRAGALSAAALAAHQRFATAMRQKTTVLNKQITEARGEVDRIQLLLVEAAKQRKIMEKLRERELARWTDLQRKRDAADADDLVRHAAHAER
jgi:flagellar FliJ protein